MRNIVIGADGTWNKPDQLDRGRQVPSNVVKMVRAVERHAPDVPQICWYCTGVGTAGVIDKMWGGAAGRGLFGNMREAYAWLMAHYRPGDRLFLFGFSRGAFTVRSLAGMLQVCGVPQGVPSSGSSSGSELPAAGFPSGSEVPKAAPTPIISQATGWSGSELPAAPPTPSTGDGGESLAEQAARIYRISDPIKRAQAGAQFREKYQCHTGHVHFLGVWDTVGAMGLPTKGPLGWATRARHRFHNVQLGDNISHAYHALAINEQRAPFEPALWQPPCPPQVQTVQQMWFPGVHSNVGGGYVDAGLSDVALQWMMESAASHGLVLNPQYLVKRVDPNVFGELRDSLTAAYRTPLTGMPRPRVVGSGALGEALQMSVQQRWVCPSRPDELPFVPLGDGGIKK
ncbi:MAG: DUF2235 domain-containing protein [Pseudohongiella sp.]|nr:DUF2235 domain-containing protein [Pseudohongiella sp.]